VYDESREQLGFCDKTFRNLLNNPKINWSKLLLKMSSKVIKFFSSLTSDERTTVFIVDDSMYERPNGKKTELSAKRYDHANKKFVRGYRFLQLGWSDGNSFVPVEFSLQSGERDQVSSKGFDKRTSSGKRRSRATGKANEITVDLVRDALNHGIKADYVLYDSWFSSPKMFKSLCDLGIHSIAMVKRSTKVHYNFNGQDMDVKSIFNSQKKRRGRSRYLLEVTVDANYEGHTFPMKLVYVRNRNKRNDYLVLASTDTALTPEEIIRIYGKRWSIEVYFKICKQYLHLRKYQGISYDGIFGHTVTVTFAYLVLAVQHREQVDDRTIGDLFYLMVQELADVTYIEAIELLIELFNQALNNEIALSESTINNIIVQFLNKLPKMTQKQLSIAD
jgi:hypothetical protein